MKTCQIILLCVFGSFLAPKTGAVKECYLCEEPCENQQAMKKEKCDGDGSRCAIYGTKGSKKVDALCLGKNYTEFCETITDNYTSDDTACYECSDKDLCNSYMPVEEIFKKQKKKD